MAFAGGRYFIIKGKIKSKQRSDKGNYGSLLFLSQQLLCPEPPGRSLHLSARLWHKIKL